jgi:hypothetical protein
MRKTSRFTVDPTNLDRSSAEAFAAHTSGKLSYQGWKATVETIERLRGVEVFRRTHEKALYSSQHPEHAQRVAELQGLYESAFPDEPGTP